ncbi:hypothetical protein [Microbulbifer sp. ALW1]|uniref:hypothetical protein n=1 Tax=Microbulbifer sp. (strain ALW1) TaxID=1516059 RepID=UPI001356C91C|nr:hypothetical protein [Microbulbifer sp. ALW1]
MKKFILISIFLFPASSSAWECPHYFEEHGEEDSLEHLWENKKNVFIGSLEKGEVKNSRNEFLYVIDVEDVLKGDTGKKISLEADWMSPLTFGETYIFFIDDDQKLDFCDFSRSFSLEWLHQEDIPSHREFVERIVEITGYGGSP